MSIFKWFGFEVGLPVFGSHYKSRPFVIQTHPDLHGCCLENLIVQPKYFASQVMKCLSKGLVKGQIDQVSETVDLTWVQPRVLDKEQLKTIQVRYFDS